jgi:hypothetical protein
LSKIIDISQSFAPSIFPRKILCFFPNDKGEYLQWKSIGLFAGGASDTVLALRHLHPMHQCRSGLSRKIKISKERRKYANRLL